MASISKIGDGGRATKLVDVFIVESSAERIEFEVLEANARVLEAMVGVKQLFACDGQSFWGELASLAPTTSAAPGLGKLKEKPVLKGEIRVFPGEPSTVQ